LAQIRSRADLEGLGCLKNLVGGDATMLQFHHELEHARSLLPVQACELANFNINDSSSLAERFEKEHAVSETAHLFKALMQLNGIDRDTAERAIRDVMSGGA
jgi:hypothetical protein